MMFSSENDEPPFRVIRANVAKVSDEEILQHIARKREYLEQMKNRPKENKLKGFWRRLFRR